MASTLLVVGLTGALVTLQRSLAVLAQSRQLTLASQVMQTEMERLRLLNWNQVEALQASMDTVVTVPAQGDFARFTCARHIRDLRDGMKEITLDASWGGLEGSAHTARLITRYGRTGSNDYFYTAH